MERLAASSWLPWTQPDSSPIQECGRDAINDERQCCLLFFHFHTQRGHVE